MSPATPATDKQSANATTQTMGSFIASGTGSGSSSKVDPSPASTYGDSVATPGDGVPATPGDNYNNDRVLLGVAHLNLGDEKPVEVNTEPSGAYTIDITKYKAKNVKGYSPTTDRYSPSFALQGLSSRDDPFMAQSPAKNNRNSSGSNKSKDNRALMSDDWRSGSSSSSSDKSEIFSTESYPNTQRQLPSVRDDSLRISANNAQGYYLPAHCVFVANLLQTENEETLEAAVTQVFREFGLVFVKIRRDGKNMPFAFCQYTTQEDAERAIREGKGRHILGRPCRCEKAKAHRLFFIERNYGNAITVAEARELLTPYGELTECYAPSVAERTALNLNEGVMAHFKLFECGREAQAAFREHELYRMQAVAKNNSPARQNSNSEAARAYVARYDVDRRSIFVGNLPEATTEMQLHALFSRYGTIENILLVENPSKIQGGAKYVFAFIEFTSPMHAQSAKEAKNHSTFMGKTLKVTGKNSEHGSRNRLSLTTGTFQSRIAPAAPFHSPAPRQPEQHAPAVAHASPLTHMSPPTYGSPAAYGSPYGYPYSPYYSYGYTPEGQVAYYPAPYPSSYMAGSPGYPVRGSSDVGGTAPHPYYPYPVHAPYPTGQGNEQYTSSPYGGYYYQPVMASSNAPEDRSPTPTPHGHGSTSESPMESE